MKADVNLESAAGALAACAGGVLVAGLYVALVVCFSVASGGKVLAGGAEKYFYEPDCRLAHSVAGVRRAKTLGGATAAGQFYVVTLRTRFDERTVPPARGGAPLTPHPRRFEVADERGRTFRPSETGRAALAAAGEAGVPLDTPLRPGESYTTELVFDLPDDARRPTLIVNESLPHTRLIIGREHGLLRRRTRLGLEP